MVTPRLEDSQREAAEAIAPDPDATYVTDRAVRASGFMAWLMEGDSDGTYEPLREAVRANPRDFPKKWDPDSWMAALGYDPDLISMLARAEAEWRLDMKAKGHTIRKLELTVPGLDFRRPAITVAGCLYKTLGASARACGRPVVPGTVRCEDHGGSLVDATTRRAVLMSVYLQLVDASTTAVNTLVDVAETSKNDLARVAAAKEILDRAGLTSELNININVTGDERDARMEVLRSRLSMMREGLISHAIEATSRDASTYTTDESTDSEPSQESQ